MIVGVPAAAIGAKHCTILMVPAQFHDQGPAPLMAEAVPDAQRFAVGGAACRNSDRCSTGTVIDRGAAYGYHAACPQQCPAVVRKETKLIPAWGWWHREGQGRRGLAISRRRACAREVLPVRPIELANAGGITVQPETQYLRARAVAGYIDAAPHFEIEERRRAMEIIEGDAGGAAQGQYGAGVSESARSGDFGDLSAALAAIVQMSRTQTCAPFDTW
jgi:hypothetical protein